MKKLSLRFSQVWACVLGVCLVVASSANANEEARKRLALVIGNSSYASAPLANPANDAKAMAETLRQLGFEVSSHTDLDSTGMKQAIRQFGASLLDNKAGAALFYYAGHGVSLKGLNYLVPVDLELGSVSEIEDNAISADMILRRLEESNADIGFVVLDACRNNPFGKTASRALQITEGGLSRMDVPSGALVAYATSPGSVASDGTGQNGLYTTFLMRNMRMPGLTAEQVFKRTREDVEKESMNAQSPREESSLKGADFYFLPLDKARKVNPEAMELAYWESIKASSDVNDFKAYLAEYPKGKFATLAKNNLDNLSKLIGRDPVLGQLGTAYAALDKGDTKTAEAIFKELTQSRRGDDKARGLEGLAQIALNRNDLIQAGAWVDESLKLRPKSSTALFIKARVSFAQGDLGAVKSLLASATSNQTQADFPWQKAQAMVSSGNLLRTSDPAAARKSYEGAMKLDAQSVEAVTNLATLLRDGGQHEQALALLKQSGNVTAMDRIADSLAYQIQQDLINKNDQARQKQIDDSVKELMARQRETATSAVKGDGWTTPPIAISVIGFQEKSSPMVGRIGLDGLLGQELERVLRAENALVVDRALIDKVLNELKLGSSSLADPETQLQLGRLTAARLIAVGNLYRLNGKEVVSFRLIDTETTQVVHSVTETVAGQIDPTTLSEKLAKAAAAVVTSRYPSKGRLAMVEGEEIIVNLGSKHGILPGDLFNVLGEPKVVEFQGKVIGRRDADLGRLRIANVEDQMAFAVPVERKGEWAANLRIQRLSTPAPTPSR